MLRHVQARGIQHKSSGRSVACAPGIDRADLEMDEPMTSTEITARARARWYFVCDRCESKWFNAAPSSHCPRCGHAAVSSEQLVPPWQRKAGERREPAGNGRSCTCRSDSAANLKGPFEAMTVLITARQLAAWLKISKRSLYRMRSAGQLPEPIRLRGAVRWRAADIEAWLTASCRT